MNTFTCFTSVFGGYESVWTPFKPDSKIDYVLVTDESKETRVWRNEIVDAGEFESPRLANRFQKMRFHERLPIDHYSVYIDANIRQIDSLIPLFQAFAESNADIGLYRHYSRHTVEAEVAACLAREKVENPETVRPELLFYEEQGFTDAVGLWEGSIIFKRHGSTKLQGAMREWWDLYSRFQTRDQFSLPFVIWKHDLTIFDLGSDAVRLPKPFVHLHHSQTTTRNRVARYLQARSPENPLWGAFFRIGQLLLRN